MNLHILGIYREVEYSPGKVGADRAIMDTVLAQLQGMGAQTMALDAQAFAASTATPRFDAQLVLAMCQGAGALAQLAAMEEAGAVVINSALAIRNCYRDLLGLGLSNARVPTPAGTVVGTESPLELRALEAMDLSRPVYVKRGDLHALAEEDVRRAEGTAQLEAVLQGFAQRGIRQAYVQEEVEGALVKFYGVGNGREYFSTIAADGVRLSEEVGRGLMAAASRGARALGLEVWGGDAIVAASGFSVIDLNDWPSFERVREDAAAAIARRGLERVRRHTAPRAVAS